jgi:hypothetical protein
MTVSLAIVLATIFAVLGIAKLVPAPAMRAAAAHLGYSTAQYRAIGLAELAGAIGALIGLAMRGIGVAAATGLVLLMLGAAREHFAHRDGVGRVAVPLIVAAMATAFLLSLL